MVEADPRRHREQARVIGVDRAAPGALDATSLQIRPTQSRLEVLHETPVTIEESGLRRVFLSYVPADVAAVRRISADLKGAGIDVWLDPEDLPGGLWMGEEIRRRIEDGAAVVACFSSTATARARSYMNEELQVAVDTLRRRPGDVTGWIVPVRLDECEIPNLHVADHRTLRDLQWIDLFPDWDRGMATLIRDLR